LQKEKKTYGNGNFEQAKTDAQELYKRGEGEIGTDDSFFINFVTTASPDHLNLVNHAYVELHKKTLIAAIENETSGHYRDLLVALCTPWETYYANRLRNAVKGAGTKESTIVYCLSVFSKDQRNAIAVRYHELFKRSLVDDIKSDLSGNFERLAIELYKQ